MSAPMYARTRYDWIDAGRGLAICLVVLYHSTDWLGNVVDVSWWASVNAAMATLRMPLFFVLSGLFARKWLTASWGSLWTSKLSLFAWVFLVWGAIGSVTSILGQVMQGVPIGDFGPGPLVRAWLLSPIAPRFELWFIWALALFFVAAKLLRRVDPRVQLAVAAVVSAAALSGWETPNVGWSGVLKYFAFFLAGLYLKERIIALGSRRIGPVLVATVLAWALLSVAMVAFELRSVPGLYFLNCVLGVVAGVTISRLLVRVPRLSGIGANTLPVYLTHTPLIIVIAFALWSIGGAVPLGAMAGALPPLVAAIAITLSLILSSLASRGPLGVLYRTPRTRAALPA